MRRIPIALSAAVLAAAGLSACGVVETEPNLIAGKLAYVEKCGSCHVLNRAGTKGIQGPNLDEAFRQSLADGIERSTIQGVVHRQIEIPNRDPQLDPQTGEELIAMPADLVEGDLARDVAAYVAYASAQGGEDPGRLADIGTSEAEGTAKAEGGKVEIPADPMGQLVYEFANAEAPAGALEMNSPNDSNVDHNIALEGGGLDEIGPVVANGGVSTIKVEVKPGAYTFYCSVPGHREGGMEGELTVK
ncbi:MAG: cupredoxin domain-containing protein [Solirubrobacteraceae bacterium]